MICCHGLQVYRRTSENKINSQQAARAAYSCQGTLYGAFTNMDEGTLTKTKEMLDDMHKRKIDMADEIFVINVGGYIGDSTRSEIDYAIEHGKKVRYLED